MSEGTRISELFAASVAALTRERPDVVVLSAAGLLDGLECSREDSFLNAACGEQNLVLMASGLALGGKRVFAGACAAPLIGRAYDQIRAAVAIPGLPVCLVGLDAGFCSGHAGAPRQMFEDVALMRALPNMTVLEPADRASLSLLLREAASLEGPSYLRLGAGTLSLYDPEQGELRLGGGTVLRSGADITLCACGIMVQEALKAAEVLARQDISAEVVDCYSLHPFPSRLVLSSLQRTGCCVTAEEHFLPGGLFEIVSSLAAREYPVPVQPVAVRNGFGQGGASQELREYYGLTAAQIVSAAVLAWTCRRR